MLHSNKFDYLNSPNKKVNIVGKNAISTKYIELGEYKDKILIIVMEVFDSKLNND